MKRKSLAVVLVFAFVLGACSAATIQAYINLAVQIALQVAQLAGAPKAAADKVAADLATVNKFVADYKAADVNAKPGKLAELDTYLTVAQADLGDILTAAQVKDPKIISAARSGIAIAIVAVESIRTLALQQGGAKVAQAAARTARVILPGGVTPKSATLTPAQLKNAYNLAVVDYPQAAVK